MRRLLIRPGALGDCLVSFPALRCLAGETGEVWVPSPVVPLVQFGCRVRAIGATGLDLLGLPGVEAPETLVRTLGGFDEIVSWYGSNRPEFRAALEALDAPVTFFPALPNNWTRPAVEFYLSQARSLQACDEINVPRVKVEAARGGYVAVHPFSGGARKNWPLERFRAVEQQVAGRIPFEYSAGPEETLDGARRFASTLELARWLKGAALYLGNDSGVSHLAAAVGTPVVALFGPTDAAVWAPRGARVTVVQSGAADRGMMGIPVEAVERAVHDGLG